MHLCIPGIGTDNIPPLRRGNVRRDRRGRCPHRPGTSVRVCRGGILCRPQTGTFSATAGRVRRVHFCGRILAGGIISLPYEHFPFSLRNSERINPFPTQRAFFGRLPRRCAPRNDVVDQEARQAIATAVSITPKSHSADACRSLQLQKLRPAGMAGRSR